MGLIVSLGFSPIILSMEQNPATAVLSEPRLSCIIDAAPRKAYASEISLSRRSPSLSNFLNILRISHSHDEPDQHIDLPRMHCA